MDPRTEQLVQELYANPSDRQALEAVRAHLLRGRKYRSLAKVLEWWARKAPTAEDAAQALVDAADAVEQSGTEPDRALDLARRAAARHPAHEGASEKVEALLLAAGDTRAAVAFLAEQSQALTAARADVGLRARLLRRMARLQAEPLDQRDAAIASYEAAVELGLDDVDVARELGQLLIDRADERGPKLGEPDRRRAADLYVRFARGLDDESAVQWLEAALDLAPDHDGALTLLEALVPDVESDVVLPRRWVAFLGLARDGAETDARRARLAKRYIAAGRIREAIACLEPTAAKGQAKVQTAIDRLRKRLAERGGRPEPAPTPELPALPGAAGAAREDLSRMSLLSDLRREHARDLATSAPHDDDSLPPPPVSHAPGEDAPTRIHDPSLFAEASRADETEIDDFLGNLPPSHAPIPPARPAARGPAPAPARVVAPERPAPAPLPRSGALAAAARARTAPAIDEDAPTISLAEELEGESSGVNASEPRVEPARLDPGARAPRALPRVDEPAPAPRPPSPKPQPPKPRPTAVAADAPGAPLALAPPPDGFEPPMADEPEEDDDDTPLLPDVALDDLLGADAAPPGDLDAPVAQVVRAAGDRVVDDVTLRRAGAGWSRRGAPLSVRRALRGPGATVALARAVEGHVLRAGAPTPEPLPPGRAKLTLGVGDVLEVDDEGLRYRVKVHRPPVPPRAESTKGEWREHGASTATSMGLHAAAGLLFFSLLSVAGVQLEVEDRPQEEIFAEIRAKPPEERPKPPPPPVQPREVQRIKSRQPDPPEPQVRIPQSAAKALKQIAGSRSGDSTSRALSALTSPNPGGGETLAEVVSNIDAVAGGDASGAFRVGGTLSALAGSSGVNIASSGGGDVGTLGGEVAAKNAGKVEGRSGRVRGRVRGVTALTRVTGSLSTGEVLAAINRKMGQIQACYERAMTQSGSALSGQVAFQWTVTTSGSVSGLSETSNTLGNRAVSTCVAGILRRIQFPRPAGGPATVRFPFMFQPAS